ncbi:hypothetical protein CH267_26605 [Rhodococcus sp. 06-621-2]|nr:MULTISPECIES: hypothetical protein [unclassified Rhodococcus (in: high G+C Gram-positive bacteria)]OZC47594.1 hypothetical protein CH267_26605 [Rhodococcus sp. 06-621-2]OZD74292.1 hypothetical protein CH263_01115 [Rhodococcus sp. 06-1059B-a]
MNFIDIVAGVDKVFAAINIIAATYFHYRYVVGPSSSKNLHYAQIHWFLSGFFVILAVLADNTLSTATTVILVIGALIGPALPIAYLRKLRRQRTPTFLDQIAADDINDRTRARNRE